jgi:hypothetical protein
MKNIKISSLAYEMLLELSKKSRSKPEEFIENTIKALYQNKK